MDTLLIGLGIFGVMFALGALGALLADWLESREWFIDWHRAYCGRVRSPRRMATRKRKL